MWCMVEGREGELIGSRLIKLIEEFRKFDDTMEVQTIVTFLVVAMNPDIQLRDLQQKVGFSGAAASRNAAVLSDLPRKGGAPGHGLIEMRIAADDRRQRELRLSPKGRRVWQTIMSIFGR